MSAARADARAKRNRFSFADARDALLARDAATAATVVALPLAAAEFSNDAIASIAAAPAAPAPAFTAPVPPAARPAPQSIEARIAETDALLARHAAGELVSADRLGAARAYALSGEYVAHKQIAAWFAADAPPGTAAPLRNIA